MSESIEFESDTGVNIEATAESGMLFVAIDGDGLNIDRTSAELTEARGMEVLDAGTHRVGGERQHLNIVLDGLRDGLRDELEDLRESSKTDEPLQYEVVERTKKTRAGGWGEREVSSRSLSTNKTLREMTEREAELHRQIDVEKDVPEDADPGDVLKLDDLLDDTRTKEEREQDALDEAAETGEEVVLESGTAPCSDPSEECNLDHVSRVATPDGEIETRRTHTW